ncbi:MAG: folate-binding protein [Alphaproteobacteria bacterium]|nr:folate-binding protein [Alphaproteobacteria bacterium]
MSDFAQPALSLQGTCPLPHLGVIRCQGEDAARFLHNQLTNDVELLPVGQARLAGFCNAQGRLQATFVVFKHAAEEVWLITRRDLLPRTLKRLTMFVLRAKVKLSDISEQQAVWGLAGEDMRALSETPLPPWATLALPQGVVIGLYPVGEQPRALLLPQAEWPFQATITQDDWLAGEVLAGVADVQEATFEAFVPQMLNHESVGGVNFKKGCYPGQEVVARSQFRGTLKRRTFVVQSAAPIAAGTEVFAGTESCGQIAQSAPLPQGGGVALACLLLSQSGRDDLQAEGLALRVWPLPYPLLQDI